MRLLIPALLAAGALCLVALPAAAASARCTTESRDAEVPSGTQTDSSGRTWAGFKAGGLPPDSLSKSSEVTSCDDYAPPPPP